MKHTSSTGRFLRTQLTKMKLLKTTVTTTISTLGLLGSLTLFKQIEKSMDPNDSEGLALVHNIINQINTKIKDKKPPLIENKNPFSSDFEFIWLLVAIPCLATCCLCSWFCLSFVKKLIRMGLPDPDDPTEPQPALDPENNNLAA